MSGRGREAVLVTDGAGHRWAVLPARSFWLRLRGLIARRGPADPLASGALCLLFPRCSSVHTVFMAGPIDVAFAAADGRVLRAERGVAPLRLLGCPGARYVLERMARPDLPWPVPGERLEVTDGGF